MPKTPEGKQRATQQWAQLRKMIEAKKWSGVRLVQHTRAFIETHKPNWRSDAPPWVVADFFGVLSSVKLIPLTVTTPMPSGAECYRIEGKEFWRMKDGYELPFEKVERKVLCSRTVKGVEMFYSFPASAIPEGWFEYAFSAEPQVNGPISEKTQAVLNQFLANAPAIEVEKENWALLDVEQYEEPQPEVKLPSAEARQHMEETKEMLRGLGVKI